MQHNARRVALATLLTLATAIPVFAVVGGTFDADNEYPAVCSIVFNEKPELIQRDLALPQTFSSGVLVHPRVVLTAGHTVDSLNGIIARNSNIDVDDLAVTFVPDVYTEGAPQYAIKSLSLHPGFHDRDATSIDAGVVVLEEAVTGIDPIALPSVGELADLDLARGPSSSKPPIYVVGYGNRIRPNVVAQDPPGQRYVAEATFKSLRPLNVMLSECFALDEGGFSRGDSGGGVLWTRGDGSLLHIGIPVNGDHASVAYGSCVRTDLKTVLDFVQAAIDGLDD